MLVKSPKPVTLVPGNVSADGKVTGTRLSGARVSQGIYTLTISGSTFSPGFTGTIPSIQAIVSPHVITIIGSNKVLDPTCDTTGQKIRSNGSAVLQVDCFVFDPASGPKPTDAAFDVQISGPSHG